jgi:hypothetical protein
MMEKLLPVGAAIASAVAALYLARKLLSKKEWVQVRSPSWGGRNFVLVTVTGAQNRTW